MNIVIRIIVVCVWTVACCCSCGPHKQRDKYDLRGVWRLRQVTYYDGRKEHFPDENGRTLLRIYGDGDMLYECRFMASEIGMVIENHEQCKYRVVNKGGGEVLYFEGDYQNPLDVKNDTVMTVQHYGLLFEWVRDEELTETRQREIETILKTCRE